MRLFIYLVSIVIMSWGKVEGTLVDDPAELLDCVEHIDVLLTDAGECTQITSEAFDSFLTETSRDINNNITRQDVFEKIEAAAIEYPEVKAMQANLAMFVMAGWLPSHPGKDLAVGIMEMAMGIVMLIVGDRSTVSATVASVMIGDGFRRVVGALIQISDGLIKERERDEKPRNPMSRGN